MTLGADGKVSLKLDCNQANGSWTATSAAPDSGSFAFGTLAMTKAYCPPPSLSDQIAGDSAAVQSYRLHDSKLSLSLAADGGTYLWEPL
jgi:heat shock protein HslJ